MSIGSSIISQTHPAPALSVAIVTPIYNPPEGWEITYLKSACEVMSAMPDAWIEFIAVDDGSVRNCGELQFAYPRKYLSGFTGVRLDENGGKGAAIRAGLARARSVHVIFTDCDFPYSAESVARVWRQLLAGSDVVCGRRGRAYYRSISLQRRIVSRALRWINRLVLHLETPDSQCGLKGMNQKGREVLLDTKTKSFVFDIEFLIKSRDRRLQVAPVDVDLKQTTSLPNLKMKIVLRELWNLMKVVLRSLMRRR